MEVNETIPRRFAAQVSLHGGRPAVVTDEYRWSYGELDAISDDLAAQIAAKDADATRDFASNPIGPVALLMAHDAPLIAAILATAKSGRPWVVLDPADPPARRDEIASASGASLFVADRPNLDEGRRLARRPDRVIDADGLSEPRSTFAARDCPPDSPAAIAFTSGTTGRPKGICRSHRVLLHHCRNYTNTASLSCDDRISLLTPLHLAASQSSLWGALLNGAALLPLDLRRHGLGALANWISRNRITVLHCVPTVFRAMARSLDATHTDALSTVRLLRLGGESVHGDDLELFKQIIRPPGKLMIAYSSSETGCACSRLFDHESQVVDGQRLAVGTPCDGMTVTLVDKEGRPVPTGEVGRIVVTSRYLAQGYWNDPHLTASRFRPDENDPKNVAFDTGDLGRFNESGLLEHCGRADERLKIRGNRVEPALVEAELLKLPAIQEAAVVGLEDPDGRAPLGARVVTIGVLALQGDFDAHAGVLRRERPLNDRKK